MKTQKEANHHQIIKNGAVTSNCLKFSDYKIDNDPFSFFDIFTDFSEI